MANSAKSNTDRYLPARVLQSVGLLMLVAFAVFWAFTGRESAIFMSAAMTLILLGAYRGAVESLKNRTKELLPPKEE